MNNATVWLSRIATLKAETQGFQMCDDLTRLHVTEDDGRVLQRMVSTCKPKHRAEAAKAAAFITAIADDYPEKEAARNRILSRMREHDNQIKTFTQNLNK